jgi:hypothetical protein
MQDGEDGERRVGVLLRSFDDREVVILFYWAVSKEIG